MPIEQQIRECWEQNKGPELGFEAFRTGYLAALKEKPKNKIVDLSKIARSNIPMDFSDMEFENGSNVLGFLRKIHKGFYLEVFNGPGYRYCRFALGYPVAWFGGDCPLPEGVRYTVWLRDGDIIAFEVTGLEPRYKYPWE